MEAAAWDAHMGAGLLPRSISLASNVTLVLQYLQAVAGYNHHSQPIVIHILSLLCLSLYAAPRHV